MAGEVPEGHGKPSRSRLPTAPCCWHPVIVSLKITPLLEHSHFESLLCGSTSSLLQTSAFFTPKGQNTLHGHPNPSALRSEKERLLDFVLVGTV